MSIKETMKLAGKCPDFYVHACREAKHVVLGLQQGGTCPTLLMTVFVEREPSTTCSHVS